MDQISEDEMGGNVARAVEINAYEVLVGKSESKRGL